MESTPEINKGHGQGIQPIEVLFGAIGLTVVPVNLSTIETQHIPPNQTLHVHILYLVKNEKNYLVLKSFLITFKTINSDP